MLIGEKIKRAIDKSDYDPNKVAAAISMSTANLYRIFKRDSVETKYLEKICHLLKLPIVFFLEQGDGSAYQGEPHHTSLGMFNDNTVNYSASVMRGDLDKANLRIEHLEQRLRDKEDIIELMRAKLTILEKR
jgi:DNA-binding Xre family transcriptional regulator